MNFSTHSPETAGCVHGRWDWMPLFKMATPTSHKLFLRCGTGTPPLRAGPWTRADLGNTLAISMCSDSGWPTRIMCHTALVTGQTPASHHTQIPRPGGSKVKTTGKLSFSEDRIGNFLCDLGVENSFLCKTQKELTMKETTHLSMEEPPGSSENIMKGARRQAAK